MILALLLLLVPDLSAILRVSDGAGSIGHACPVSITQAITNKHIANNASGLQWSTREGVERGFAVTTGVSRYADLALLDAVSDSTTGEGRFPRFYPMAKVAPKPGDAVWFIGFSFDSRKKAFSERVFETRVLRVVAGLIVMEHGGVPGSSGSCVLDAAGYVVGINSGGKGLGDEGKAGMVGIAQGLWTRYGREPQP